MNDTLGTYPFVVEPFSEDCCGRLSWRFLGNHLLRCASLHAGMHGFGYDDMQEQHHAWVLSRLVIEMESMPTTGEAYTIETWVNRSYRQFTDRLFAITAPDGRAYGYAFSTWALIDVKSRQPMNLDELANGGFRDALIDREVPIKGAGRIRLKQPQAVRQQAVYYSDLDINGHVNSVRYIEMVLDLFPQASHKAVRRLEVAYSAETYLGDTLTFYQDAADNGTPHSVEVRKADDATVIKAAVTFSQV